MLYYYLDFVFIFAWKKKKIVTRQYVSYPVCVFIGEREREKERERDRERQREKEEEKEEYTEIRIVKYTSIHILFYFCGMAFESYSSLRRSSVSHKLFLSFAFFSSL